LRLLLSPNGNGQFRNSHNAFEDNKQRNKQIRFSSQYHCTKSFLPPSPPWLPLALLPAEALSYTFSQLHNQQPEMKMLSAVVGSFVTPSSFSPASSPNLIPSLRHHNTTTLLRSSLKSSLRFPSSASIKPSIVAAVAVDSNQPLASSDSKVEERKKYYFLVANAKFMLDEEEHFQEQLFERLRYYGERDLKQDFWLVIEPTFLNNFPDITKRLNRPAVALVSTNGPWITFMKLRLDRVLADSYEADTLEEALASKPTTVEFGKPDKWSAPYPKYESGWWETFLPSAAAAQSTESTTV
ncbi:Uncharacterized protein ycf54, partial [Linum grandiflorum]